MKIVKIKIIGEVQGVNFRFSTKAKADELGILGVVKNMDNGTVYIEAEGEAKVLEKFTAWCKTGSPWAKVEDVRVDYIDELKNYEEFNIER